jgi:hypothetical protein
MIIRSHRPVFEPISRLCDQVNQIGLHSMAMPMCLAL